MKKSVKIGKTVYKVEVTEDMISASEATYPLSGYGNNYGTEYNIELGYSERWARVTIECWNNTWATRGHGMTDYWTEDNGYIRIEEAKEFMETVLSELQEAENGTPDVKNVFYTVKSKVLNTLNIDDYDY